MIGIHVNDVTGERSPTTKGTIIYDGAGKVHIVPARPTNPRRNPQVIETSNLRLSAQRAFLGRIVPSMRLIKAELRDGRILVTCLTDGPPSAEEKMLVWEAGGEIISDFPDASIDEIIRQSNAPLPKENILEHGWIYQRYEP